MYRRGSGFAFTERLVPRGAQSSHVHRQQGWIATACGAFSLATTVSGPSLCHARMSAVEWASSFLRARAPAARFDPPCQPVVFIREKRRLTALYVMSFISA